MGSFYNEQDTEDQKIFAYDLNNKTRFQDDNQAYSKDVSISGTLAINQSQEVVIVDIWMNQSTIWIIDNKDGTQLPAYKRNETDANGKQVRDSGKDITLSTDNGNPKGIWSNGTVMWVSDETDGKIYAYRMPPASGATGGSDFFFSEDSMLGLKPVAG